KRIILYVSIYFIGGYIAVGTIKFPLSHGCPYPLLIRSRWIAGIPSPDCRFSKKEVNLRWCHHQYRCIIPHYCIWVWLRIGFKISGISVKLGILHTSLNGG